MKRNTLAKPHALQRNFIYFDKNLYFIVAKAKYTDFVPMNAVSTVPPVPTGHHLSEVWLYSNFDSSFSYHTTQSKEKWMENNRLRHEVILTQAGMWTENELGGGTDKRKSRPSAIWQPCCWKLCTAGLHRSGCKTGGRLSSSSLHLRVSFCGKRENDTGAGGFYDSWLILGVL